MGYHVYWLIFACWQDKHSIWKSFMALYIHDTHLDLNNFINAAIPGRDNKWKLSKLDMHKTFSLKSKGSIVVTSDNILGLLLENENSFRWIKKTFFVISRATMVSGKSY